MYISAHICHTHIQKIHCLKFIQTGSMLHFNSCDKCWFTRIFGVMYNLWSNDPSWLNVESVRIYFFLYIYFFESRFSLKRKKVNVIHFNLKCEMKYIWLWMDTETWFFFFSFPINRFCRAAPLFQLPPCKASALHTQWVLAPYH